MPDYALSEAAYRDLQHIADYTIEMFGIRQSLHYKEGLISCFETLAEQPNIGSVYSLDPMISLMKFPFKSSVRAEIHLKNGKIRMHEFYYGSSYLSQSTRSIQLSGKEKKIVVYDVNHNEKILYGGN